MSYADIDRLLREAREASGDRTPADYVHRLLISSWDSQIIVIVARLRIADELAAGPRAARDVAAAVGADPDAMLRLLRAAATIGIMTETEPDHYALTAAGECLRSDSPTAMRELAIAYGSPQAWQMIGAFEESLRTGRSNAETVLGRSFWEHLAAHPEQAEHFSLAMGEQSARTSAGVAAAVDPSAYTRIVDVGGAYGALLTALLEKAPRRPACCSTGRP
ncbi:methyltransferase family protein [Nonomuraea candida]|uniref:methyltransferase family protein n=1 Tax=Nonomuraea candida TaxID=359159 RepID=UPI0006934CE7|nr:methyltransferase dimerization domain-containing protein [Nonomuraea candida]